jgi:hypothetical protein
MSRKPPVDEYLEYVAGEETPEMVDYLFRCHESGSPEISALERSRRLARDFENPGNLPQDVWMELQAEHDSTREDAEEFVPDIDYSDYRDYDEDSDSFDDAEQFSTSLYIDTVGPGLEMWPASKVHEARQLSADTVVHSEYPNAIRILSHQEFQALTDNTRRVVVSKLTICEIRKILATKSPDAVIMDPPLGPGGLSQAELVEMFGLIRDRQPDGNTFVFVWCDPPSYPSIIVAANEAGLGFCDTICVELLDGNLHPRKIAREFGFVGHSRTAILLRTNLDLKRDQFVQQRTRDASFGIARFKGKSRGRLGMPSVCHDIAEGMLPEIDGKRSLIEFWPTRLLPRPKWELFDEQC